MLMCFPYNFMLLAFHLVRTLDTDSNHKNCAGILFDNITIGFGLNFVSASMQIPQSVFRITMDFYDDSFAFFIEISARKKLKIIEVSVPVVPFLFYSLLVFIQYVFP